ncbi:hypothetical protein [Glycomyces xiaoerkulensis]|uniref:hypothetical protein n=1 Tax=Glycomyces xiaoerkulensis TaxID=2038139 RepID=UPI000C2585D9|nr:hypothetical protein [Glycomyces xiaoerkulensis]
MGANTEAEEKGGGREARKVVKLRRKVGQARQVQAIADDPYLKVVELDRMRGSITRAMWLLLAVGLAFTTTGVHDYIAAGLTVADPMWWGGWAVEPTFAGLLITLLRWETIMATRGVAVGSGWVRATKYLLLGSTLVMNLLAGLAKGGVFVALHLIIPALVFCLAEVMPVIQERFTTARDRLLAEIKQADATPDRPESSVPDTVAGLATEPGQEAGPAPVSPTLPPVASEATASEPTPPADVRPPKLPPQLMRSIETKAAEVAETGRAITAGEIQQVVKLPTGMAEQAARYFAAAHARA